MLVSHNLAVVAHLCPMIGVMQGGEMVEQLSAEDLRAGRARHPHTAELRALSVELEEPEETDAAHDPGSRLKTQATLMRTDHVPARDGVRLATDIHLPDGAGPFPIILERTPYGRDVAQPQRGHRGRPEACVARRASPAYFTRAGYAVVYPGHARPARVGRALRQISVADAEDGFDTCAWLVGQPWCDGRICTMGLSYAAHTQAALGCLDPPGLVAQVLDSGGFCDAWHGGIRQSGAFELKQATWAYKQALLSPEAAADPVMRAALEAEDIRDWFARMPWKPGHSPLRHHPDYEAYLFEQWTHGAFDEFWQRLGIWAAGFHARYSRAACVHMSSWYDPYPLTATGNYLGLKRAGRGAQRLILGPVDAWRSQPTRCSATSSSAPMRAIDAWAGDWRAYRRRFFDHVVQGRARSTSRRCACS